MKKIKLFILVAFTATSSCFAMRTTGGWRTKNIPEVTVEVTSTTGKVILTTPEITSMAIDGHGAPWVTTRDGKILRYGFRRDGEREWKDMGSKMSNLHDKKMHTPSKFKYVVTAADSSPGNIYAIDEDVQIYQWLDYDTYD